MGLSDLMKEISQDTQSFYGDEASEIKVLNQVLKLVEDKISEVKNQAVKWCAFARVHDFMTRLTASVVLVNSSRSSASPTWRL